MNLRAYDYASNLSGYIFFMRKYFVISGFAAAVIAASSVARAGTGEGSTSTGSGTSSSRKVPTFTLDQAILTALQRNPTLLIAEQEIKRTLGVIIQIRAQALPNITPSGSFEWIDPNLRANIFQSTTTTGTTGGGGAASIVNSPPSQVRDVQAVASPTPNPNVTNSTLSDVTYNIQVTGTQLIFNGTTWPSIRGTFFQRDSAYFSFRNILDQLLATVKTQFYQVVVNRELIKVQEQSVQLLQSQLQDQQNRELIKSQEKNVEQAEEALRLAKARLDAGAGVQLDVLNAQVQLLTAQSTRLQALFGYNSSLAEFDRATGAQSTYSESFADLAPRATRSRTYDTSSGTDATGKRRSSSSH